MYIFYKKLRLISKERKYRALARNEKDTLMNKFDNSNAKNIHDR